MRRNRNTLGGGSFLDMVCPINWQNELNRGLVARRQCMPGLMGGSKLINLTRAGDKDGNHGTLTNDPTWQGALGRPGGFGSLRTVGNSLNGVSVPFTLGSEFTLSIWIRPDSTLAGNNNWWGAFDGGAGWLWRARVGDATDSEFYDGAASFFTGAGTLSTEVWQWFAVTLNGGVYRLYKNGLLLTTSAGGQAAPVNTAGVYLGRLVQENTVFSFPGLFDNAANHSRALSASEVMAWYLDSIAGSPQTLNWISTRAYFGTAAAATTRGMPFGRRSTAFNGGRCLVGNIR